MSRLQDRWIGKKNLAGYIRFWYYKRRGWVWAGGMYYTKPNKKAKK